MTNKKLIKFKVHYEKTFHLVIEVEAENEEEATKKADKYIETKTKEQLVNESQESYFDYIDTCEVEK